ncbi:hypothetical protein GCM10009678_70800 [Actinomadura kijaniata]|uniref:D-alanyl-D-alanine carboxypeptidase (Penicillin-binding protein 5/6) n=1 Tax=Actinomadura namibiensis TaxID=182080 RepID=A0A7W3QKG9_ACTNM|nr:D-alanyl-D-alanine carboxypeptidase [Actinomadura namibiensis]MBA8950519.1 D-alanyl-D-alanine carboxypeptidase (penicillin-binding protein 5/6) [Actinomadura namibiensis]
MRITPVLAALALLSGVLLTPGTADARTAPAPPGVRARSALLVDDGTSEILWGRRVRERRPIGSLAKLMTAVVVVHEGGLNRRLRVRPWHLAYAHARHGTVARLRPGDRIRVRDLLHALLLPSGSDAAAVLAEAYGPGHHRFVRKMNRLARAFGMTRTRYSDAAGLPPSPGHSTARDQVVLGRYALGLPELRRIVRKPRHALRAGDGHGRYVWLTTNTMLGDYPGLLGVKSGYTLAAGASFLFAARRHGRTLVGVVLNSSPTVRAARFRDARKILNWGFHHTR